jgi:hypothetical protein
LDTLLPESALFKGPFDVVSHDQIGDGAHLRLARISTARLDGGEINVF